MKKVFFFIMDLKLKHLCYVIINKINVSKYNGYLQQIGDKNGRFLLLLPASSAN